MKQIIDLQYLGYSSDPSRNVGVKKRWIVMDGKGESGKGGERAGKQEVGSGSLGTHQISVLLSVSLKKAV